MSELAQFSLDTNVPYWYKFFMCFALKNFLENNGMGAEAFAARVGCSRAAVVRYASGARMPTKKMMAKIFVATGGAVQPNDFYDLPSAHTGGDASGVSKPSTAAVVSIDPTGGRVHAAASSGFDECRTRQIEMFHAGASS